MDKLLLSLSVKHLQHCCHQTYIPSYIALTSRRVYQKDRINRRCFNTSKHYRKMEISGPCLLYPISIIDLFDVKALYISLIANINPELYIFFRVSPFRIITLIPATKIIVRICYSPFYQGILFYFLSSNKSTCIHHFPDSSNIHY